MASHLEAYRAEIEQRLAQARRRLQEHQAKVPGKLVGQQSMGKVWAMQAGKRRREVERLEAELALVVKQIEQAGNMQR